MSIMTQMTEESHEWQRRAEKAEAEVERLRMALEQIRDSCRYCRDEAAATLEPKP